MGRAGILVVAAGAMALATGGEARAADVPIAPVFDPVVIPAAWYLRGYIGISNQEVSGIDNVLFGTANVVFLNEPDFDTAAFFGAGIGYKFNPWLRGDVTGEYRANSSFHAFDQYDFNFDGIWDGTNDYTARKNEWLFLANVYIDLGTWMGITPYLGAGIGTSRNTISDFTDVNIPNAGYAYAPSASTWQFAWALHAGVGWEVAPNFIIDLGYRYVDLGDAETGDIVTLTGVNTVYNPMYFDSLTSHDVHLGVRYAF